jgi:hypothetical protein
LAQSTHDFFELFPSRRFLNQGVEVMWRLKLFQIASHGNDGRVRICDLGISDHASNVGAIDVRQLVLHHDDVVLDVARSVA